MKHITTYNEAFTAEDRLKFVDKEIKRLMALTFEMEETEEKELLNIKISELMDERDDLRSEDGSLPPEEEEVNPTTFHPSRGSLPSKDFYDTWRDNSFSETLPPIPVGNRSYYTSSWKTYKKSRQQLADDTPVFEKLNVLYKTITSDEYRRMPHQDISDMNLDTITKSVSYPIKVNKVYRGLYNLAKKMTTTVMVSRIAQRGIVIRTKREDPLNSVMEIYIHECQDEYFSASVFRGYNFSHDHWSSWDTYKCDGVEGVIQLLEVLDPKNVIA